MGLNDFILNCEKDNEELEKDLNYFKNRSERLQQRIDKALTKIENLRMEKWSITGTDIIDVIDILQGKE